MAISEVVWPEDRVDHIAQHGDRFPGGTAYPVTARDMTTKEKRRYAEWKER